MKLPQIRHGDTIGVFSPSSPVTHWAPQRFERSKRFLESKGFKVLEGSLTGRKDGYRSGTIEERAHELNELIRNPEVRCIMTTIGGMNSNSLLPYIDYEALKADPKLVTGYSDATALLLAIYAKTGIQPLYGPALVASFGELPPFVDWTYEYFEEMTMKGDTLLLPHILRQPLFWTDEFIDWETQNRSKEQRPNQWIGLGSGTVRGRLMGGNLNTLQGIWGSPYMPDIQTGDILLIEDSLKDAATVERSFAWLNLNGIFDKVAGILLGKHELFNDQGTGRQPYEILLEVLNHRNIPIIADFDCCHTHPMIALPIGAELEMDVDLKQVKIVAWE